MSTYVLRTEFPTTEQVAAVRAQYTNAEALMKSLAATRKAVGESATGTAAAKAQHEIAVMEEALRADASFWLKSLAWHQEMHAAGVAYRKNSPTIEDRTTAETDVRAKLAAMKATGNALDNAESVLSSARYQLTAATTPEYVTQAQANVAQAQTARDNAKTADDKASKAYRDAKVHLADVTRRMKAAEDAYSAAVGRAKVPDVAVTGGGDEVPGAGAGTESPGSTTAGAPSKPGGPSKPAPSTGAGAPAAKPGASSPAGAAAPAAKTTESGSSKGSSDADLAAVLAGLRAQGETTQTGPAASQAAPVSAAPSTGAGTGKPGEGKDGQGSGLGSGRPWDLPDIAAATGTSVDWFNGKERPTAAPTTTPAPATTAAPAASPAAKLAGAVPSTPTTGTSVTGVSTSQDVSGRSTPTPTAYSPAPGGPSTSTSAAHGTGTGAGTSAAGTPAGRAGMGTGMPMMPMMPGMGGGAGGAAGDRKPIEKFRTSEHVSLLNGEHVLAETVGGYGTLGQGRDRD